MLTWFSPEAASAACSASAAPIRDSAAYPPAPHPAQSAVAVDQVMNRDLHGTYTSSTHAHTHIHTHISLHGFAGGHLHTFTIAHGD